MHSFAALKQQLPVLLVVVPLVGMATVALARLAGNRAAERTLQSNLLLGFALAVLLFLCFDVSAPRATLSAAVSYQSLSRIRLPSGTAMTFGVDGVVLIPLVALFAFVPALMSGLFPPDNRRPLPATSFLAWIATTALALVAGDLMTLAVAVLLSTSCSWWFASASPLRNLPGHPRWLRMNLLSAFLIVGGLLGLRTSVVHFLFAERSPEVTFSFPDILRALEVTSAVDAEHTLQFEAAIGWWLAMIMWGCLIRFPLVPLAAGAAQLLRSDNEPARLFLWLNGPLIGLPILWRSLQIAPDTGIAVLTGLTLLCSLLVLWFGLAACGANDPAARRGAILMQAAALLGVGATSVGEIAAAGTLMLTLAVALDSGIRSLPKSPEILRRTASGIRIAAAGLIVWGVIPSEGFGLTLLLAGVGLTLGIAAQARSAPTSGRWLDRRSTLPTAPPTGSRSPTERPVFPKPAAVSAEELDAPLGFQRFTLVLLLIPLAALFWPQLIWSRVKNDVRHLEIARVRQESSNGRTAPPDARIADAPKGAQ